MKSGRMPARVRSPFAGEPLEQREIELAGHALPPGTAYRMNLPQEVPGWFYADRPHKP